MYNKTTMKIILLLSCAVISLSAVPKAGGLSEVKVASQDIQDLVDELQVGIAHHAGADSFSDFTAVSYKSQVVGGANYFVKIRVGVNDYIHARLFVRSWENVKRVEGVQTGKGLADPIEYFESRPLLS